MSAESLTDLYRRETLSFLQYVRQSAPYVGPADKGLVARIFEMADSEKSTLSCFADYLMQHHIAVPQSGGFPSTYANYNFVDVKKLIPLLITDQTQGIAAIEGILNSCAATDRDEIAKVLTLKRQHLGELETIATR